MGTVYEDITIKNAGDTVILEKGLIREQDVHEITVNAIVDTGAMSLVINEDICKALGLSIQGERYARVANGQRVHCKITEPVEIHWKDRSTACQAVVIPGAESVLLGAIPLEGMDLMVDPVNRKLVGVHGNQVELMILAISANHPQGTAGLYV